MKTIKDSVHDHIEVEGVARALFDTPAVQRLRRIKQLGPAHLVYPSANHTRFEHSLGVYYLACEGLDHLGIQGKQAERVRAAAILHDVGHAPYSHTIEEVIHRHTGKYHDDVHDLLKGNEVGDVLRDHGHDPDTVADLIAGEGKLGQLVSGELDVDRMDYLVRDAHHTGVPYGTIDHSRLVRELTLIDGELVLAEGNVPTAESLLLARTLMNPTVYNHHVTRICRGMLQRASERLLAETDVSAGELRRMDDHDFFASLRGSDATAAFARRLGARDLYKRAVWAELADVPDDVIDADHDEIRQFESDIAADADVEPESVIIDVLGRPSMTESSTRVIVNGEIRRLGQQSTLVSALRQVQREQWRLGVYAPEDETDAVGHAAERVLGLETDGALVSEVRSPGQRTTLDEFGAQGGE
ncbi:HD domain-containing protein [Halorussus gelatinilyticus]|uniref:HD domain-containing protein n=1 Tax=Halorussus gelatinilyticus TaxID=2937524 RepID=A0A8U0IK22_9EURY|nr:HD domain-containing protein [Halorussus gelatinilyticus]UPW00584.1 HD domain-containing protein [Halorussus gelatinilyticus]